MRHCVFCDVWIYSCVIVCVCFVIGGKQRSSLSLSLSLPPSLSISPSFSLSHFCLSLSLSLSFFCLLSPPSYPPSLSLPPFSVSHHLPLTLPYSPSLSFSLSVRCSKHLQVRKLLVLHPVNRHFFVAYHSSNRQHIQATLRNSQPGRRLQDDIAKEGTTWNRKADRRQWKTLNGGYILQWMDKAEVKKQSASYNLCHLP